MDPVAVLQQLDAQCGRWSSQHDYSCNLLSSMLNIMKQRDQTLMQAQEQEKLEGHSNRPQPGKSAILPLTTLHMLIQKQTLELESIIGQMYETLKVFEAVVRSMSTLENQFEAQVQRSDLMAKMQTTILVKSKDYSLLQTAEISPIQALEWISRIRAMYKDEFDLKHAQLHSDHLDFNRLESIQDWQHTWGLQRRIDYSLEQEIEDRIKTWRKVRQFALALDS